MQPEQLGPYKIVGRLGRGGMGAVYSGIDEQTQQRAAVKILARELVHEADFRHRFAAEIATLRRLNHPNIVRLFGFGEEDGQLFYAMELVEGVSLEEEISRGRRFAWSEVAQIAVETCRALRHAHDRGVIHRDIKPANLLLTSNGVTKLSDFGIARLFGSTRMTMAGIVIGTVEYMPPEQADGRPIDHRADLYSLGGVMYALLAGRAPFKAKTLPEMLDKQRHTVPEPIADLVSGVPRDFSGLIAKLLAKNPADRFPTALVLGRHLNAMLSSGDGRFSPAMADNSAAAGHEASNANNKSGDANDDDGDVSFDLGPKTRTPDAHDPEALLVTRDISDNNLSNHASAVTDDEPLPPTKATDVFQADVVSSQSEAVQTKTAEAKQATVTNSRFTVVSHEELGRLHPSREAKHALISAQTWVLAAALLIIGMGIWYALRPPSADALYKRITAKTAGGNIESIVAAQDDIKKFLLDHADDPRCALLRKYEQEITLDAMRRKFNLRMKIFAETDKLLPIERDYLEARNYAWLDPAVGMKKFQALVDLYGHGSDISAPSRQCLELARREIDKLRQELEKSNSRHLELLNDRLNYADELSASDPEEAMTIWRAAVELYAQKPWAAAAVQRASSSLEKATQARMTEANKVAQSIGDKDAETTSSGKKAAKTVSSAGEKKADNRITALSGEENSHEKTK